MKGVAERGLGLGLGQDKRQEGEGEGRERKKRSGSGSGTQQQPNKFRITTPRLIIYQWKVRHILPKNIFHSIQFTVSILTLQK